MHIFSTPWVDVWSSFWKCSPYFHNFIQNSYVAYVKFLIANWQTILFRLNKLCHLQHVIITVSVRNSTVLNSYEYFGPPWSGGGRGRSVLAKPPPQIKKLIKGGVEPWFRYGEWKINCLRKLRIPFVKNPARASSRINKKQPQPDSHAAAS